MVFVQGDVSDLDAIGTVADEAWEAFGRIDTAPVHLGDTDIR